MIRISLALAVLVGCAADPPIETSSSPLCAADDPDCVSPPPCYPWNGTMYPWCALRDCPLGVSDEPLRYEPCTDRGAPALCFCRSTDETYPLTICGLYGDTWVPNC